MNYACRKWSAPGMNYGCPRQPRRCISQFHQSISLPLGFTLPILHESKNPDCFHDFFTDHDFAFVAFVRRKGKERTDPNAGLYFREPHGSADNG